MGSGAKRRLPVRNARQLVILPTTHLGWLAAVFVRAGACLGRHAAAGRDALLDPQRGRSSRSTACTTDSGG